MKKPRGDAKLKTLPDALQETLFQTLRRTTAEKTAAWLLEKHGVATSTGSLSEFFSWYPRTGWLKQSAAFATNLEATIKKLPELKISAEQASQVAQVSFEIQAAQNNDPELFLALQDGKLKAAKLQLDERKVKLLEAKAAQADQGKAVASDEDLSPEEQLAKFRQIFGGK